MVKQMKTCPKCKQDTVIIIYGNMWDVDFEFCSNRACHYEVELKTITSVEPDGSLYVIDVSEDEDER